MSPQIAGANGLVSSLTTHVCGGLVGPHSNKARVPEQPVSRPFDERDLHDECRLPSQRAHILGGDAFTLVNPCDRSLLGFPRRRVCRVLARPVLTGMGGMKPTTMVGKTLEYRGTITRPGCIREAAGIKVQMSVRYAR